MAIDFVIDYDCTPKQTLGTEGLLERLKGRRRAQLIIQLYRKKGDDRPPTEMGFEFTRNTPDGQEETQLIVVQDLLDEAAALDEVAHHCEGCPANRLGQPFGCAGFINYPISYAAEEWLLDRLPVPDEPLIWLLLKRGVEAFAYDGNSVQALRRHDAYFERPAASTRRLGEFEISANMTFEMLFTVGHIIPNHAGIMLLFFHVIPRHDLEAEDIMSITPAPADAETRHPFKMPPADEDDTTIRELKDFFLALYTAWKLDVPLNVDS